MKSNLIITLFAAIFILDGVYSSRSVLPRVNPRCECGWSNDALSNRIIGGVITLPHIFPWITAIFVQQSLFCGGALINDRYILTAGHCIRDVNVEDVDIGLGMHDISDPGSGYILPIEKIILHEDFESDFLHDTNDIALLKLRHPVKYNDKIQPVCLPTKGSDYTGHLVKVSGWGKVKTNGGASKYLREATLRVMPFETCTKTSFGDHLTESMMCAYSDNRDACQGDSGGPLLFKRTDGRYDTIGIVSWGLGCARRGVPGVYVKLTDYLLWIKSHTKDAIYCMDR